ncbi:hypothetical protein [Oceanomicrobium pacificus]|uniref:Uncharacterized protein n=1 Tax=Oceanomicrobium pacificus TaxID=2692916 RepID=A0A6B0TY22_9RHOB|nr:hypothetical protein [Oceanomicrobium pacificus]MXU66338.1 hypothetical protein [Oceanomicrobium pacificus]
MERLRTLSEGAPDRSDLDAGSSDGADAAEVARLTESHADLSSELDALKRRRAEEADRLDSLIGTLKDTTRGL